MEGCFFYCAMCCTTHINEAVVPGEKPYRLRRKGERSGMDTAFLKSMFLLFWFGDSWFSAEGDGRIAAMATRCEDGESALAVRASVLKRTLLRHSVFTECVP